MASDTANTAQQHSEPLIAGPEQLSLDPSSVTPPSSGALTARRSDGDLLGHDVHVRRAGELDR